MYDYRLLITRIEIGHGCLIAKTDIKDAFRINPIHAADHRLLGVT